MNVYPIIKLDSNYFFAFNQLKFDLQVLHFSLTGLLSWLGLVSNSEIVNFRVRDISILKCTVNLNLLCRIIDDFNDCRNLSF